LGQDIGKDLDENDKNMETWGSYCLSRDLRWTGSYIQSAIVVQDRFGGTGFGDSPGAECFAPEGYINGNMVHPANGIAGVSMKKGIGKWRGIPGIPTGC
jgi:hypothetical protein